MVIPKTTVRKYMDTQRKAFLMNAKTPREIRFGQDKMALDFAVNHFHYFDVAWMGNFFDLDETNYRETYDIFTKKKYYDTLMKNLIVERDENDNKDVRALIEMARVLRKRYERA